MLKATPIPPAWTPMKFQRPDQSTAGVGLRLLVSITVATALAVSWNPLMHSKPKAINRATMGRTIWPELRDAKAWKSFRCPFLGMVHRIRPWDTVISDPGWLHKRPRSDLDAEPAS